uniref:Ribosome-recycling factor, mitochondrial n=1 Tax=Ornithorhynchus anatinus TaxID=9258 RepID=A0A6I8NIJ0_ORNAN
MNVGGPGRGRGGEGAADGGGGGGRRRGSPSGLTVGPGLGGRGPSPGWARRRRRRRVPGANEAAPARSPALTQSPRAAARPRDVTGRPRVMTPAAAPSPPSPPQPPGRPAKGKGQAQARVNLNAALVEDIINLEEVNRDLQTVMEALKDDFNKNLNIRTSAGALDHISVPTEDGKFSLNQLAQISMKSPQLVLVNMANFPECTAAAIKAIRESGMNLNPEVDGTIIRVPIPKVTREHREMLVKLAKQNTNKAKESLRKVRTNAMNKLKKSKDKVAEDTIRLIEKKIGQMADDMVAEMDKQLAVKTKELLG